MSDTTGSKFIDLATAIDADEFPEVDLALRRGRHVDRQDAAWYGFLVDAQEQLEPFYRRFGCDLVHRSDGYFYLLPAGDKLPRRQLGVPTMLVGQALALLYLDPATVQRGGVVDRDQVLGQLDGVVGTDALIRTFNPKRRKYDERVAQETVRKKVAVEVRRLAGLGFAELVDGDQIRLRPALMRFAEPVRGEGSPAEALARLVASGEIAMAEDGDGSAQAPADGDDTRLVDRDDADSAVAGEDD